ncbi:MAG: hypothetical protein IPK02_10310 [Candidatus Accumulibacter sp.]|uniref:Uncharacterized protein n=1 Tax=Candidatus Accumulibacter affinis TaxID=2954384 RepID=A0A935W3P8_9PROT|nr:hypothetical protein [Candidatus Accumulibacter affinis]
MTTDGRQDDRTTAAYGHHQALLHATRPAAAAFAERILGKYFVAPVIRHGPSLVLRMLQNRRHGGWSRHGEKGVHRFARRNQCAGATGCPACGRRGSSGRDAIAHGLAAWMPDCHGQAREYAAFAGATPTAGWRAQHRLRQPR